MKKRTVALAVLVASLLTACGSNGEEANATDAAKNGEIGTEQDAEERVITWMTTRSAWPAMDQIAAEYMEQHPNVKIEFDRVSDRSSYNQKVQILASSDALPDLFDCGPVELMQEIGEAGKLVDADELYAELGYTDRMLPIGLEWERLPNGKLYALAWENNVEYFWYHKAMFEDAGITETPKTFDAFLEACQKLKDKGYTPIAVWPGWEVSRYLSFMPYCMTGNAFLDGIMDGSQSMNDPIGLEASQFLQKLGQDYFMPGWSTSDYTGALETFLSGNAAMYYIGAWQFGSFLDENGEIKDDYAYFKMPTMEGATISSTDMYANAGTGSVISKAKFDDTLKDFVTFVLNEYPDKAFWDNNVLPAAKFDTEKGQFSSFWQSVMDDCNSLTGYAKTWDVAFDPASAEVLSREQTNLGMGAITPEEFGQRIDEALAAKRAE